jgi:hypothetical protein
MAGAPVVASAIRTARSSRGSRAPLASASAALLAVAILALPGLVSAAAVTTAQTSPSPVISNFKQSAATWRLGTRLATASRSKPPVGTTFSFDLNVPASTLFAFTRIETGRTVGGKCVRRTAGNRHKRRCERFIPAGHLTIKAHAGTNKVRFEGRVTRTRHLKAGHHQLTMFATDSKGQNSFPNTVRFTVVAR